MDVQFSGMALDDEQKDIVNNYSDSFCRSCSVNALHINAKEHKKAGGRTSYAIQLRAEIAHKGKRTFEITSQDAGWDFHVAVKTAFKKLEREVRSKEDKSWFGWMFRR